MNGESYNCVDPVCPYCKAEKWDIDYGRPTEMEYDDDFIIVTFDCVCKECGKKFHEERYYHDTDCPMYFPVEESE